MRTITRPTIVDVQLQNITLQLFQEEVNSLLFQGNATLCEIRDFIDGHSPIYENGEFRKLGKRARALSNQLIQVNVPSAIDYDAVFLMSDHSLRKTILKNIHLSSRCAVVASEISVVLLRLSNSIMDNSLFEIDPGVKDELQLIIDAHNHKYDNPRNN